MMLYDDVVQLLDEIHRDVGGQFAQIIQTELRHPDCNIGSAKYNQGRYDGVIFIIEQLQIKLRELREES